MDGWTIATIIGGIAIILGGVYLIARPSKRDREVTRQLDEVERQIAERAAESRPKLYDDFAPRPEMPPVTDGATRAERVTRPASARRLPPPTSRMGRMRRADDDVATGPLAANPMFYGGYDATPDRHGSGTGGHGGTGGSDHGGSSGGGSDSGGSSSSGGDSGGGSF